MSNQESQSSRDTLFSQPRKQLSDFAFDQSVVDVFPDMIRRSVPGYENIIAMLGVFARSAMQPNTNVYDLGCSLGAATLAMHQQQTCSNIHYIGIDNSQSMLEQCKTNLQAHLEADTFTLRQEDIQQSNIENASLAVLNFTLQFLPPQDRNALVRNIYQGLNSKGALVLSEKIAFDDSQQQEQFTELYHTFKRANLYSDMEISQKRTALENVLIPDTIEQHLDRLKSCGFETPYLWFQNLNFVSFIAIK